MARFQPLQRPISYFELTLLVVCALSLTSVRANPSVFPEDAVFAALSYSGGTVGGTVGFETILPVRYLDLSLGLEAYAPLTDLAEVGFKIAGSALVFPAFGTTPPLALGLGADTGYGPDGLACTWVLCSAPICFSASGCR